ncbi:MAG: asparagine synthase (glutamine-hydrolyzing) [Planctomycetota bacterium]|nr:asparagine synthase (glutamine-hydrolyzing) [Planctomycetota bacterium]
MCGIAGYVAARALDTDPIDEMTDALSHRGPDGRGVFRDADWHLALGHRRLAIIDPNGGAQPMHSKCGRYVITFNGAIYNYHELRRELVERGCRFRTTSDTEVLLQLFIREGEAACRRLNGMFAFAVANLQERSLFLARDPMGEKPLLYTCDERGFAFASEMKSLLRFPGLKRRIDPVALHHFLSLNYVPGKSTMMEGVRRLPGGCCLRYHRGRTAIRRYDQTPPPKTDQSLSLDRAGEEFEGLLDDSVRLRLRSDVPVGVFLSSGVDSSLIASSAARLSPGNGMAFTIGFDDSRFNELPLAAQTARQLGVSLESRTATWDAGELFDQIVRHADDPLADSSSLPTWHLCQLTASHRKVVLGGDGADELFAGYLTHRAAPIARRYRRYIPEIIRSAAARSARYIPMGSGKVTFGYKLQRFLRRNELPAGAAHLAFNGTWLETDKRLLYNADWNRRTVGLDSYRSLSAGLGIATGSIGLSEILSADQRQYLPDDILAKTDRMSMAHGLEVRSPYLDPRMVSFAASLPDNLRIRFGRGKRLLRAVAARRGLLAVARRPKQGFSIPIHDWLRHGLRTKMLDLLSRPSLESTGVFNPSAVRQRIESHLSGRESIGFELWGLMVFMSWWHQFVETEIRPSNGPRQAASRIKAGKALIEAHP